MKIHVSCVCGRKLAVDETLLGKQVRCPVCRHTFVATAQDEAPPAPAKPAGTFAIRPEDDEPAPKPAPVRRRRRTEEEDDEEDEKPVRRKRRQPAVGEGFWHNQQLDGIFVTAGIFLLILGGVGIYLGIQNLRLAATASDTPQTLTLSQLIANGPGDNAHVIVTDLVPANNYVYSYQKGKYEFGNDMGESREWTKVYVPLVPLTPDIQRQRANNLNLMIPLQPRKIQVIVIPKGPHNKVTTDNWCLNTQRVQGMVVNLIQSLDNETQKLLKDSYPDTDFSRCWILKEGETPARAGTQLLLITASTIGIVLSAFYFIVRFIKRRQVA